MAQVDELKQLVVQTLDTNGVLAKLRAELRMHVFSAIADVPDPEQKQSPFLQTKDGEVLLQLAADFLKCCGLEHTLSVLCAEAKLSKERVTTADFRKGVAEKVGVSCPADATPVLQTFLETAKSAPPPKEEPARRNPLGPLPEVPGLKPDAKARAGRLEPLGSGSAGDRDKDKRVPPGQSSSPAASDVSSPRSPGGISMSGPSASGDSPSQSQKEDLSKLRELDERLAKIATSHKPDQKERPATASTTATLQSTLMKDADESGSIDEEIDISGEEFDEDFESDDDKSKTLTKSLGGPLNESKSVESMNIGKGEDVSVSSNECDKLDHCESIEA